ncbi:cytidylyltransferase domain-containing protein [Modestobacter sp. SYSU DS0875]
MTGRVVAVVQARMSSQRLPGKVLEPLGELRVIDWAVRRTGRAGSVSEVVVATSDRPTDDVLAAHCREQGHPVSRGSLDDVLDRFLAAAEAHRADHVVRVTGDCPLVDPEVVDRVVAVHLEEGRDFTANRLPPPHPRTWPLGLDVEVATIEALRSAWETGRERHHREHVMPYLYEEPGRFDVRVVDAEVPAGSVRWTVDTPEDLAAVRALVEVAGADLGTGWRELLATWQQHPELARLNAGIGQRTAGDVDERA